jgi:multidrug transporter EmrE-like cation transporter
MLTYGLVLLGVLLNVGAQIALKKALPVGESLSMGDPARLIAVLMTWPIVLGLALYGLSVVNWVVVLSRLNLGVAYPLMSLGYVLTYIVGIRWFGEPVSWVRLAGILVIITGVVLISRPVTGAAHG